MAYDKDGILSEKKETLKNKQGKQEKLHVAKLIHGNEAHVMMMLTNFVAEINYMTSVPDHFQNFKQKVSSIPLPENFTFPFYYDPHPLALIAASELQAYLSANSLDHNFGLDDTENGLKIGKMFGVLVVLSPSGELGYLCAYSGKLQSGNIQGKFVPPVYDMLTSDGFFKEEEAAISLINTDIEELEHDPRYCSLLLKKQELDDQAEEDIRTLKQQIKANKLNRKELRSTLNVSEDFAALESLRMESIREQYYLKDRTKYWSTQKLELKKIIEHYTGKIDDLKMERKNRSSKLQERLFKEYRFLNYRDEYKSLSDIFSITEENRPPSGAGECSAPKLLHFAYIHHFKPIAMAEFWWGASPQTEVRKHGLFYPACRGKCEPILGHMLEGLKTDPNPLLHANGPATDLEIVYEDEYLAAINKPTDLLSVPGVNIWDSVYTRLKDRFPEATGPLIVHRLDMSTSGILMIAKNESVYKQLQRQFMSRKVKKTYLAILDGIPKKSSGTISLPLRVDLNDRPRQMVCFDHGKPAVSTYRVLERTAAKCLIEFMPITGRTHQLRVHAAHPMGLNIPICGDDLYGIKNDRLYLQAQSIEFLHPSTKKTVRIIIPPDFTLAAASNPLP